MSHRTATVLVPLAIVALIAWAAPRVLLILLAGILAAVAIRSLSLPLSRRLGIREGWGALLVFVLALLFLGLALWFGARTLLGQAQQFAEELPRAWDWATGFLADVPGSEWLREQVRFDDLLPTARAMGSVAMAGVGGTLATVSGFVIVVLLGVFLAADPSLYRRGFLALLAPSLRPRAEMTFDAIGEALRGWLLGQLVSMVVLGVSIFVGLSLLGIPLAGFLAMLTAIFSFIPYVGPILGGATALLITLAHDPSLLPWVLLLIVVLENLEGSVLSPLVQERAAKVPPALMLATQALFATMLGFLGLLLAAPVAAAGLAAVRVAYVEGWVEAPPRREGEPEPVIRPPG